MKTAEDAVAKHATSALVHEARGEALSAMGRMDDAVAAFRKALELDPKLSLARTRLAFELSRQNKAAEAVAEARKATEADPKAGEAFAVLGLALLAQNPKDFNAAIAEAQQGAFVTPKSPMVQVAVGKIFESDGQLRPGLRRLRSAPSSPTPASPRRAWPCCSPTSRAAR